MKKTLFAVALVAAFTFAGCGNKSQSAANSADSTAVATDTTAEAAQTAVSPEVNKTMNALTAQCSNAVKANDPKAVTTTLADMAATYKALVNAGKLDEAKAYGSQVKAFVNQNAEALKGLAKTAGNATITDLVTSIENLPTAAATTADEAKQAVTDDVVNLASPYIKKGAEAAATAETAAAALKNAPAAAEQAARTAVNNAGAAAKQAVDDKVNEAQTKAQNEVTKAQNKAAEKVNEAQNKAADEVKKGQQKANDAVNKAAGKALKGLGL